MKTTKRYLIAVSVTTEEYRHPMCRRILRGPVMDALGKMMSDRDAVTFSLDPLGTEDDLLEGES